MPLPSLVRLILYLIFVAVAGGNSPAWAGMDKTCPQPPRASNETKIPPLAEENPSVDIRAREMRAQQGGISEFSGEVELRQGKRHINADELRYDKTTGLTDATGHVLFRDAAGLSFLTPEMHLNLNSRLGHTGPGSFELVNKGARGDAQRIDFKGVNLTHLKRARFTTCAPGQDDWFLKVRELKLDTQEDMGTAYDASIHFLGVPVFYLPYLSFPISDRRQSGFLLPRLGQSTKRGLEVATPYYLNLAPNYDATITPRFMSERGMQWQTEFRYLATRAEGTLELEALPNDRETGGNDRGAGAFRHSQSFTSRWSGSIDLRGVSDKQYLDDFGDDINITSQTHLPQNAVLDYRGPTWNFSARAAEYQTVDPSIASLDRPYARLPQLNLTLNRPLKPNSLNYQFEGETVNFERDQSVTGGRINLAPSLSLPLTNSYGYFTPNLGARFIAYRLNETTDETPSLTRGVFSLDSGLFFERESHWADRLFTQTLEPRLYYLYIPARGQDHLPNFDTSVPELSFPNLFRDNRFVGGDRIGDSNQITAAVTTRFIDDRDGSERVRASLGRIYYFTDRKVNLPAGNSKTTASDIVGEATATLTGHWYMRAQAQWNRIEDRVQKYSYYFQYQPAWNRIINLGKRFSRDELEQTDLSTEWPIKGRWTFRGRSLYSLRERRNIDSYAGVEYNACCWALRVLGGRRLSIDTENNNAATQVSSILLELELTGLSKLGHVPDSPLRQSVFNFSPPRTLPPGSSVP